MDNTDTSLPCFSEQVDCGSWSRFTPTCARFIDAVIRPHDDHGGAILLLTAPSPIVNEHEVSQRRSLRELLTRQPRRGVSTDVPGIVLTGRADGVELAIPIVDHSGAVLVGRAACESLAALGWSGDSEVLARVVVNGEQAASALTRVLIEVLDVPHPADLDWMVTPLR